jgi:DNA-binding transcriptional LysR family regulator
MSFRTLDLNLLRVFDVVMDERNLTRAAARLAMTQPAVSNALKRLRDAVGVELFARGARGVTPTADAESLWPAVREALAGLREALDPQDFDPRTDARSFRIATADATATMLMPALVTALEGGAPGVNLRVLPLTTRDPRGLLEQGQADLALGFFPVVTQALAAEGPAASVRMEPLYDSEYVAVMRRDHPLAAPGALDLDAYCAARHLLVSFSGRPHGFVDEALGSIGRRRRIVLTVNQFFTAGRVVTQSGLLTVLPRRFVPATGFGDELALQPLPFAMPVIHVALLWHRRHEHDAAQRWLRATIVQCAHAASPVSS